MSDVERICEVNHERRRWAEEYDEKRCCQHGGQGSGRPTDFKSVRAADTSIQHFAFCILHSVGFYAQNSGKTSSLSTLTVRRISTATTVGLTILLPFLMARPAPR